MKNEDVFKLEFSERKKEFRLKSGRSCDSQWATIYENCTVSEFDLLKTYLGGFKNDEMSACFVLEKANDLQIFVNNLLKKNISISAL